MFRELQSHASCACHTWEAQGELIKSCCFTQKQVLEGNCQLAREEEAALGARRKQGQVSRGAEASPGL